MLSMSRGVIKCAKQFLSHPLSQIKWVDQWEVDLDPVLIPGTCVQYPGLQGGGALGDASTRGTPATPWPRARTGARTATLPWRGARGAGKGVPPPPRQRRRPARVARRPLEGPALRRAAHLRTAGGAADTAHGRVGGTDRRATGRLQPRRSMASEIADEPPLQKLARRHHHPRVIVGGSNRGSRRARSPRATRGGGGGKGGRRPVTPVAGQSFSAT